jgi:hypothetical protein
MKKRRISSFIYWIAPIFIDALFLFLSIKFLLVFLDLKDKTSAILSIFIIFFWLTFHFTYRFKTVFIDENHLYIFKYLGLKKIELTDVKSVRQMQRIFHRSSNSYIIEYLDDNLNAREIKFYGSFFNRKYLDVFLESR